MDRVSSSDITELHSINSINQMRLNDELCGYGMETDCGCLLYMMFPVQIQFARPVSFYWTDNAHGSSRFKSNQEG